MEGFSLCSFVNPYLSPDEPVAYMPHHSPRWPEIKVFLARIAATCRNIFHLVSLFDYLEHLVNLGPPSTALLQLIPSRETFVGLGNYLFYHTAEEQKNFFFSSLLPKILGYASEVENIFLTSPLTYSRAFEEFSVSIPRSQVASLVACSFLCLYPNAQRQNCLFSDVNFTYFFRGITSESTVQVAKLQAILQYFACLSASEQQLLSSSSFRIRRRSLRLKPLNQPPMGAEAQPLLAFCGRQLVEALRGTHLPLALIDNTADKEIVSEMFDLPIIDFVNSYVGGGALRASELSPKSVYFRYPETLVALALCCRLEGPEALWIDNYLGPFGPSMSPLEATKPSTFRRLVVANSTRFPVWASELQYTEAGIIDEVVKTTAALFQVDLDDEEIAAFRLPSPFSHEWWLQYSSLSPTETGDIPRLRLDCESFGGANLASTREARTIERFARHLSKVTLRDALQACIRCPAPLRPHHGHPSLPNFTVAASHRSLDRRPRYRQEGSPDAVFSFQNPANLPARKTPSRPFESNENLCDSSCGTSLGALLEGLPGKFTETVGLLTNEVMSEVRVPAATGPIGLTPCLPLLFPPKHYGLYFVTTCYVSVVLYVWI
uniref:Poly(ADP-ribose) glycohydrolase n=2 Tax=Schistocephalus solidus TaxID=70667 RepID=A0A0X3Q0F0_SCHSO